MEKVKTALKRLLVGIGMFQVILGRSQVGRRNVLLETEGKEILGIKRQRVAEPQDCHPPVKITKNSIMPVFSLGLDFTTVPYMSFYK